MLVGLKYDERLVKRSDDLRLKPTNYPQLLSTEFQTFRHTRNHVFFFGSTTCQEAREIGRWVKGFKNCSLNHSVALAYSVRQVCQQLAEN